MTGTSLSVGLRTAAREWRLVVLLWIWHLLLALIAIVPLFLWWVRSLGPAMEAARLVSRWDLAVMIDLLENEAAGMAVVVPVVFALAAVAALGSVFITTGLTAVLISRRTPSGLVGLFTMASGTLAGVLAGGGRFFWRNLRLTVLNALSAVIVVGIVYAVLRAATAPLEDSLTEIGAWTRAWLPLAGAGLAGLFWSLTADFGRIGLVARDERAVRGAWFSAVRFVWRHLASTAGLWIALTVLAGLGLAAYIVGYTYLTGETWGQLTGLLIVQQVFFLWRAAMRVALTAGEIHLAHDFRLARVVEEDVPVAPPVVTEPVPAEPQPIGTLP